MKWLWHALAVALLLLAPSFLLHVPIWSARHAELIATIAIAAGYAVAAMLLALARQGGRTIRAVETICVPLAVFALVFFALLMRAPSAASSRAQLIALTALALALLYAQMLPRKLSMTALGALGLAALAAVAVNIHYQRQPPLELRAQVLETDLPTAFYTLHVTTYRNAVPRTDVYGGGFAKVGDRFLLATGDGRIYTFTRDAQGKLGPFKPLSYHVPLNRREFIDAVNAPGNLGALANTDDADKRRGVQVWQFRVADILAQVDGGRLNLYASHHFWDKARKCFVVRVSMLEADAMQFLAGAATAPWRTLYETHPCIPLQGEDAIHANNPFSGMEIGGRMALRDSGTLLLTLGDHNFAGIESRQIYSQDPAVSYGKTVLIDLHTGEARNFTLGHRNPQGVYIDESGLVWATEHGPQGGDELNLLAEGKNYGWPMVTYGTDYGAAGWPLSKHQGSHEGYEPPIYSWIPSMGVSSLLRVRTDRFPVWKGDLLVGSLHGKSLFRIRLEGSRAVYAEPIELGRRVRDVMEDADGAILVWTDSADVISIVPANGSGGAVLFAQYCGGCHKAVDGKTHGFGPDLHDVVGRKAATVSGYDAYSPALKAFGGTWSEATLDHFLTNPQALVPGSTMTFQGVKSDADRAAIIKYLAGLR